MYYNTQGLASKMHSTLNAYIDTHIPMISLAVAVALESKLRMPESTVDNIVEYIDSHAIEGMVVYFEVADYLELDMPLIVNHLKKMAKLKYDLRFNRKSITKSHLGEENELNDTEYYGISNILSKSTLDTLNTTTFEDVYILVLHSFRDMDKFIKIQNEKKLERSDI